MATGLRNRRDPPLSSPAIGTLLRYQLYAGIIDLPEYGVCDKRGDFDPIITRELFDRAQAVLSGKSAPSPHFNARHRTAHRRCRVPHAQPEPDFRYFSNSSARRSSENSTTTSTTHGLPLTVVAPARRCARRVWQQCRMSRRCNTESGPYRSARCRRFAYAAPSRENEAIPIPCPDPAPCTRDDTDASSRSSTDATSHYGPGGARRHWIGERRRVRIASSCQYGDANLVRHHATGARCGQLVGGTRRTLVGQGASSEPTPFIEQETVMPSRRAFVAATLAGAALSALPGATAEGGGQAPARRRPILVFDVNETMLDINALEPHFARAFGDGQVLREWFSTVLQSPTSRPSRVRIRTLERLRARLWTWWPRRAARASRPGIATLY